jgi:hypothetical protein
MKYEVFSKVLRCIKELNTKSQKAYAVDIDLLNFTEPYSQAIWHLFGAYYGKSGKEWIEWFIYEKDGRKGITAHNSRGEEICKTEKELWKMIEKEKTDDYDLTKPLTEKEREKIFDEMAKKFS